MTGLEPFHVIVVAAGRGTRSGSSVPKQYALLGQKPVLRHSLEVFLAFPEILSLIVVIDPEHHGYYQDTVGGLALQPPVLGGKTRKESVSNGLSSIIGCDDNALVLIHDAARPFLKAEDICSLVAAMKNAQAATLALPVADTVLYAKETDGKAIAGQRLSREHLWALHTPQAFRYSVIKKAHENLPSDGSATDDTALVSALGIEVKLVEGSRQNFKLTYPDDFRMAERILMQGDGMEVRTGLGYDVHRFADSEISPKSIRLCGIDIPFDRKLEGHSDADVGLHALTDALLGAIGEADIGTHFPPSDSKFKGADSAAFLKHAADLMKAKGGRLVNADLILICEAPKIGQHREKIVARIAEILDVLQFRINVKATTTEKLGFTGRKEGIVAQAVVSVALPCSRDYDQNSP